MIKLKLLKWCRPSEFAFERQKYVGQIPHKYSVDCRKDEEDGVFYAKINEIEGVMSFGDTELEAVEMAYDALLTYLAIPREVAVDLKPEINLKNKTIKTKDCFSLATA
ncbi:MAG: type II toxin-antitoxin system HicB family antitoxin [Patescibacteria group bacterium]